MCMKYLKGVVVEWVVVTYFDRKFSKKKVKNAEGPTKLHRGVTLLSPRSSSG